MARTMAGTGGAGPAGAGPAGAGPAGAGPAGAGPAGAGAADAGASAAGAARAGAGPAASPMYLVVKGPGPSSGIRASVKKSLTRLRRFSFHGILGL